MLSVLLCLEVCISETKETEYRPPFGKVNPFVKAGTINLHRHFPYQMHPSVVATLSFAPRVDFVEEFRWEGDPRMICNVFFPRHTDGGLKDIIS